MRQRVVLISALKAACWKWLLALVFVLWSGLTARSASAQLPSCASPVPPSARLGDLFEEVQLRSVFPDSKTFADMVFREEPAAILAEYQTSKDKPGFDLAAFINRHFSMPAEGPSVSPAMPGEALEPYIARLWDVLKHQTTEPVDRSSLLSLPYPYVVPGGRFRELYYWDSYFIMLGLEADKQHDLARDMVSDIAFEIDCYGHVPNGNRTYYLSRSQPPFFALMLDLIASREGQKTYLDYLPELEAEYEYWMDGSVMLRPGQAYRRVVRLADGTVLNRYWDDLAEPRDESYREDLETALGYHANPADLFRNLRAAAESGWDFSSRWLADGHHLNTIRTVDLLPVDLNSLMGHLERTLAKAYELKGDIRRASGFERLAAQRQTAIRRLMWDEQMGIFTDYLWHQEERSNRITGAGLFPLFLHLATARQGQIVARTVDRELLTHGGLATTLVNSGQQWDQPNGWAPLEWVAVVGLDNYDASRLAQTIATRWTCENIAVYQTSRTLVEKYNLVRGGGGGGGEYALQVGFGWTNGVLRALASQYPRLANLNPQLCKAPSQAAR
jgi:alpha,alpha-trehalase